MSKQPENYDDDSPYFRDSITSPANTSRRSGSFAVPSEFGYFDTSPTSGPFQPYEYNTYDSSEVQLNTSIGPPSSNNSTFVYPGPVNSSYKLTPTGKPFAAPLSRDPPREKDTYANRAAKATGDALARFGKAIIGSNPSNHNTSNSSVGNNYISDGPSVSGRNSEASSRDNSISGSFTNLSLGFQRSSSVAQMSRPPISRANSSSYGLSQSGSTRPPAPEVKKRDLRFYARSEIMAMGPSATENAVAVAGKDFFQILRVENDGITLGQDVRGSHAARDFDKFYTVTDLNWGRSEYRRTIALSNSGGQLLVYNVEKAKSVLRLNDGNRAVNSIRFHPIDTYKLVSSSADGSVKVWDLRQQKKAPVIAFLKTGDNAREVQCSPFDANKVAAIYDSGAIIRWDSRYPRILDRRLNAHTGAGLSIDWHVDYDYIVSAGIDRQIQVWNMSSDSRKPELTISNRVPISKVRWQHDILESTRSSKYGVLNSDIVSCNMSIYDQSVVIWNPRRPFIPHYILEPHQSSVTDVFWRSQSTLWTISKDKTFAQTVLDPAEMAIKRLNSQAFSWTNNNSMSFVVQDRHEEIYFKDSGDNIDERSKKGTGFISAASSPSTVRSPLPPGSLPTENLKPIPAIYTVDFPGASAESFRYCAENYYYYDNVLSLDRYIKRPLTKAEVKRTTTGLMAVDICGNNAIAAAQTGKFRTSQTWRMLQEVIGRERISFLQFKPIKEPIKDRLKPYASRITESLKSNEPSPLIRPVDDNYIGPGKNPRDASLDRSFLDDVVFSGNPSQRQDAKDSTSLRYKHNLTKISGSDESESYSESPEEDVSDSSSISDQKPQSLTRNTASNAFSSRGAGSTVSKVSIGSSLSRELSFSNSLSNQQLSPSEESVLSKISPRSHRLQGGPGYLLQRSGSHVGGPGKYSRKGHNMRRHDTLDSQLTDSVSTVIKNDFIPQTWADVLKQEDGKNDVDHTKISINSVVAFDQQKSSATSPLNDSPISSSTSTEKVRIEPFKTRDNTSPQLSDIARAVAEYASYVSEASDNEQQQPQFEEDEEEDISSIARYDDKQHSNLRDLLSTRSTSKDSASSLKSNSSIISSSDNDDSNQPGILRSKTGTSAKSGIEEDKYFLSLSEDDVSERDEDGYESTYENTEEDSQYKLPLSKLSGMKGKVRRHKRKPNSLKRSEQLEKPVIEESKTTNIAAAVARVTQLDNLTHKYREYQRKLEYPWQAEKMIQQAAWYAVEQGDIQMCATLGMLFLRDYPGAFVNSGDIQYIPTDDLDDDGYDEIFRASTLLLSPQELQTLTIFKKGAGVVETWIHAYLETLRKHKQHVVAAGIIKQCPFPRVQRKGKIETSIDLICQRCGALLAENISKAKEIASAKASSLSPHADRAAMSRVSTASSKASRKSTLELDTLNSEPDVGYWYCNTCENLLDGCSYCDLPVKGLSVCLFECGHKMHSKCLSDWAHECGDIPDPSEDFNIFETQIGGGKYNSAINAENVNNLQRGYANAGLEGTQQSQVDSVTPEVLIIKHAALECPTGCGAVVVM